MLYGNSVYFFERMFYQVFREFKGLLQLFHWRGVCGSSGSGRNDYKWIYFPSLLSDVIN